MKLLKALVFFLLPAVILAQTHFNKIDLKVRGDIQEIQTEDLDGDGIKELIVLHHIDANDSSRRFMSVFWAGADAKYSSTNSSEIEIPGRFSIYDFGSLPGEKEQVVLFLSKNTAEYYRWTNHQLVGPTKLVGFSSQLIQMADSDRLLYYHLFYDWNLDGQNELMVFQMGEAEMFYYKGNQWTNVPMELPFDVTYYSSPTMKGVAAHMEFSVNYRAPNLFVADKDGDGKHELFATSSNKCWIFKMNPDGTFATKAALKLAPKVGTAPKDQQSRISLYIADVDQDGTADLLSNNQVGSFFNQKSEIKIFYGKNGWADPANKTPKPVWTASYDGWVFAPIVIDVNADKQNDLVVPVINSGILNSVKAFVVHDFPINLKYYLGANHALPAQASSEDNINIRVDFGRGRMMNTYPQIFADFNGDGIDDLIFGKSDTELTVVLKNKQEQRTADQEILKVPTAMFPVTDDLNNDNLDDLVLVYAASDTVTPGQFSVLINKGGWKKY